MTTQAPIYIVDIISAAVSAVDTALYSDGSSTPAFPHVYYMHGHPLEIVNRLQEKVKNPNAKDKRFPLIALFQDFKEERGGNTSAYCDVSLNMVIIQSTKKEYDSTQRYSQVLKPVLYPIYYELMNQLRNSTYLIQPMGDIKHDKWDRLYWGKNGLYGNTGNIFDDHVDAIELMNVKLKVNGLFTSVC